MRPATRLTWLRGFSQSAMAAVTLTHWGDQVLTPQTKLDRILVLLSSKLPATGLNWRAGRLHAHMPAVNKRTVISLHSPDACVPANGPSACHLTLKGRVGLRHGRRNCFTSRGVHAQLHAWRDGVCMLQPLPERL